MSEGGSELAIVGVALRFPGANDLDELWENLRAGIESITRMSREQVLAAGANPALVDDPRYVRAHGCISHIDLFDAALFGFTPRDAEVIDPQQRLFLECAWEALEHAAIDPSSRDAVIGVFAGASRSTYAINNLGSLAIDDSSRAMQLMVGNERDFLPAQVSYQLDLTGPSINVQTACSTSLVAVHLACQSLLAGECDVALAGAASIPVPQEIGYLFSEGMILAPDGHCRPFDARARGTVPGSGVGIVVLERLDDALAKGRQILGVIKGSAINNDGRDRVGFTAPGIQGQCAVITEALAVAGTPADSIGYVEAHGTATALGDPNEIAALTQAFRVDTKRKGFCAIGSIKSNFGHLDTVAGVAGLMKAMLSLSRGELPPSLHFERPNPNIDFGNSPFYVNDRLRTWPSDLDHPRRAGVSSFGIGGTNAHVILEEPPEPEPSGPSREVQVLTLSAGTRGALDAMTDRLAAAIEGEPERPLADVAFTLALGRRRLVHRRALVCSSNAEAVEALRSRDPNKLRTMLQDARDRPVAFLFPGQGAQHVDMARGLLGEAEFRDAFEQCSEGFARHLDVDLAALIHGDGDPIQRERRLANTAVTQPALFAIEYALARQWMAWGIVPSAMLGHSIGEWVAACIAEVLTLDDAIAIVARRGELMAQQPPGAMLSVQLPEAAVRDLLGSDLSLAAINAASQCVVAGPIAAVDELQRKIAERGVEHRRLAVSHAFHSSMMEPIASPFSRAVARAKLSAPKIPILSSATGTWLDESEATSIEYWTRQALQPVRFEDGVSELVASPDRILLEVGPGNSLSRLARAHAARRHEQPVLSSCRRQSDGRDDREILFGALAQLWLAGAAIDWASVHAGEDRRRVALPTYPFERRRHWVSPSRARVQARDLEQAPEPIAVSDDGDANARPDLGHPAVAPRNERETQLQDIWRAVLGFEGIGVHDDFFELGGHSLLATRVIARIRSLLGVELPIATMFERPTIADLASELPTVASDVPIPRRAATRAPLSFAQQRLWFIDQLDESNAAAYNEQLALRIDGGLDVALLQAALDEIVRRHESLRTVFALHEGQACQIILSPAPISISRISLPACPPDRPSEALLERVRADRRHHFDLAAAPPLSVTVIDLVSDLGPVAHALVLTMHHIITDGWSLGVLLGELSEIYTALARGKPHALPQLPIQYADFAAWQREHLRGEPLRAGLEFWRRHLDGAPPVLSLPSDRPRGAIQSLRGASVEFAIDADTSAKLASLGLEVGATVYVILLSAFAVVLSRHSGSDDLVIGSPVANRLRTEFEGLIGFFVNNLPLRISLDRQPTFRELLAYVRELSLAAQAHQDIPFDKIVEALRPDRDLSHSPLFQVMFVLQNAPMGRYGLPGLRWRPLPRETSTAQLDLVLVMLESDRGWVGLIEYSTDLFDRARMERFAEHYCAILRAAASDPDRRITELPMLDTRGLETRPTQIDEPSENLVELFEREVDRHPNTVALHGADASATYAELDARANRLAHYLLDQGIAPETRVGLCQERGFELVVTLLGLWKAGATHVPLSPDLPAERVELILQQTQTKLVLCDRPNAPHVQGFGVRVVVLDDERDVIAACSASRPHVEIHPEQLAYVIYTSGSTGRPKGVAIPHRCIRGVAYGWSERFHIYEGSRVLQYASTSFDVSVGEIATALLSGATLVAMPPTITKLGPDLERLIHDNAVTHIVVSPSVLSSLRVEAIPPSMTIIVGGEPCSVAVVRTWAVGRRFINGYGPTETTIGCVAGPCDPSEDVVTFGRPFGGALPYVLDRRMVPVPIGVTGELYIGGPGVTRGYLDDPTATASRFLPDPFSHHPGARIYQTGDLVRQLEDGRFVFVGRADRQIKLRGYRIELGEIEAALTAHDEVRAAAVVVREDSPGVKQLVGYVVAPERDWVQLRDTLRRQLAQRLPAYMIPTAFVRLDALPITTTDKLDIDALPPPESSASDDQPALASSETMTLMAQIWADVLGRQQVGIHDNFFELGGDSILSIRILARLNEAGLRLSPRQVFQHQTIAELAAAVESPVTLDAEQGLVTGPVVLTPIQRWFLEQDQPAPHHFNQSLLLETPADLDLDLLRRLFAVLVEHHDVLRTRFERRDGEWTQAILGLEHQPRIDEVSLAHAETAASQAQSQFELDGGSLVRAVLFRDGFGTPGRLLVVFHHLVIDAVSTGILVRDLAQLHRQHLAGEPLSLPRKTTSFQRWAERLATYAAREAMLDEQSWWMRLDSHHQSLPRDRAPGERASETDAVQVALSPEATRWLLTELPRTHGTRIEETLLWSLARTLCRWSNAEGVLIDLEGHGRENLFDDVDLSRSVGWFTISYPVWLSPTDQLESIRVQLRSVPRGGIGYGLLRFLSPDPDRRAAMSALPRSEVTFNYFGQDDQTRDGGSFAPTEGPRGRDHAPSRQRQHVFELDSVIANERLHLRWTFDLAIHDRITIERLAASFIDELERIAVPRSDLSPRASGQTPPASHVQVGMLAVPPKSPLGRSLRRCVTFELDGPLDTPALVLALQELVRRHEILRTAFQQRDGEWMQIVHDSTPLVLPVEPLDDHELARRIAEDSRADLPFDTPPLRLRLHRLAPDRHVLFVLMHEIITDVASVDLFARELAQLYTRLTQDQPGPLPALELQYGDFASWQRKHLSGATLERELAYWRDHLRDVPLVLTLPLDRPRPHERDLQAEFRPLRNAAAITSAMDILSERAGVSRFAVLHAAFGLLMAQASGPSVHGDVVVGIPVAGRTRPALRRVIGPFVNALPVRVSLRGDPTFLELLTRTSAAMAEASDHDVPIDLITTTLAPDAPPNQNPIFQCFFTYRRGAAVIDRDNPLRVSMSFQGPETLRCDLALAVVETEGRLEGGIKYARDVFDPPTIDRLLDQLSRSLETATQRPELRCSQLSRPPAVRPTPITSPWLLNPRPLPTPRLRLICIPYAGGNGTIFRDWQNHLPADIEVIGIHPPGRGSRLIEPALERIEPMVEILTQLIEPLTATPYVLFGHSMGAIIAYELARNLRKRGRALPQRLLVSGHRAPHVDKNRPDMHALPRAEFLVELERLAGTPKEILQNPELLELVLPTLRADFSLIETWRWTKDPPLPVSITGFCGDHDVDVPIDHMRGWDQHATGTYELHILPGDHFFIHSAQEQLLSLLADLLAAARPDVGEHERRG